MQIGPSGIDANLWVLISTTAGGPLLERTPPGNGKKEGSAKPAHVDEGMLGT